MSRYNLLKGIDAEIMLYVKTHPEPKDCSVSKMIKEGAVRKTATLARPFLKNHLNELEEKGLIYSLKVQDPIRKVEYTYYTLKPNCQDSGECGIPPYIEEQTSHYYEVLQQFYSALQVTYVPLLMDYGALYKDFKKVLNKPDWDFVDFSLVYQSLRYEPLEKITRRTAITPSQVEELNATIKKWENSQWTLRTRNSPPLFLEDLTSTMIGFTISYLYRPICENCKTYRQCLNKSLKWVNALLKGLANSLPESDLTRFWQSILSGVPEVKSSLLEKYFQTRFNLKKQQNSTVLLKIFEDRRLFPFLYSKVIPISLGILVEQLILPCMKNLSSIYGKYNKVIRPKHVHRVTE